VDSAQQYHNEREVGEAMSSFLSSNPSMKREDIHFTSKLAANSDYETAKRNIKKSIDVAKNCGLGYIDLYLLHSPYGGKTQRLDSWRALEDAVLNGDIKIGGVSNYGVKHVS
jgi:diketogulonate reductase-like aldo/keto reductase